MVCWAGCEPIADVRITGDRDQEISEDYIK